MNNPYFLRVPVQPLGLPIDASEGLPYIDNRSGSVLYPDGQVVFSSLWSGGVDAPADRPLSSSQTIFKVTHIFASFLGFLIVFIGSKYIEMPWALGCSAIVSAALPPLILRLFKFSRTHRPLTSLERDDLISVWQGPNHWWRYSLGMTVVCVTLIFLLKTLPDKGDINFVAILIAIFFTDAVVRKLSSEWRIRRGTTTIYRLASTLPS